MTRRRDVERELAGLSDIRSILDAMRNLALLETRKIERFLGAHERALQTTSTALADLARFHPSLRRPPGAIPLALVLGSERGLCGDFNEALLAALREMRERAARPPSIVAVGARLASRLQGDRDVVLCHPGPSIAEDVDPLIAQIARSLGELLQRERGAGFELQVLFHAPGAPSVRQAALRPVPDEAAPPRASHPPRIHLAPDALLAELSERYLILRLQALLYGSLLAENESRLRHMDAAIRKVEQSSSGLRSRRNRLRQEEITEEIEILILSAERP
jgi:F-type H+-transporting ATPase subunit gamma